MPDPILLDQKLKDTLAFLSPRVKHRPQLGLILGSGLGSFAKELKTEAVIPYTDIPHFMPPTIEGHSGQMIFGTLEETPLVCLQGRIHYYEGHPMSAVVYPVQMLARLGVSTLLVTNAAGGLDPLMEAGDFMIITDHINLMGTNPLIGPNDPTLGPRFPDMSEPYSKTLQKALVTTFQSLALPYHQGVYCGVTGPSYETPAEVRYLRLIGGSAVGMSTVPEVIAANHMGLQVCGLSCITNKAAGITSQTLSHADVTETAKKVEKQFSSLIKHFILSLKDYE